MAELPDIDVQQAMADAGMQQGGPPPGAPPMAPPGGAPPAGLPQEGGLPSSDEIDDLLSSMNQESMVPEPEAAPQGPNFEDLLSRFKEGGDDGEKELLSNRVQELERQLGQVLGRFDQQKAQAETSRVRGGIDEAVRKAMNSVSTGHGKLDKAAADFVEGALVYRLAQQQQKNPEAPVDVDAIERFASKSAQALSRWAKEHAKKTETETRKAAAGTASRPKAEDFELKTDADFDKYVAAFIGKGG